MEVKIVNEPDSSSKTAPVYPQIRENGITPLGFGIGESPCFCTKYNGCSVYILHSLVSNPKIASSIFSQLLPTLEKMWPNCGDRKVKVKIGEKIWRLLLYFSFSHILVLRKK